MPAPLLMSKFSNQKHRGRTTPVNAVPSNDDDDQGGEINAVHEYKKVMEDIQRECPDLSAGAVQQMALKRCAILNEQRELANNNRDRNKADLFLRGMMSKLRIGNNSNKEQGDNGGADADAAYAGKDKLGSSTGRSTIGLSNQESDMMISEASKRRSLAVRRSVCSISSDDRKAVAQSLVSIDNSVDEESLQDSLEDIERKTYLVKTSNERTPSSIMMRHQARADSIRHSRRMSGLTLEQLSDVEEDEESSNKSNQSKKSQEGQDGSRHDASSSHLKVKSNSSSSSKRLSVTAILPDEIKVVFDYFENGQKNDTATAPSNNGPGRRKNETTKANSRRSTKSDESNSNRMSFVSVDSTNFAGDFSAWG